MIIAFSISLDRPARPAGLPPGLAGCPGARGRLNSPQVIQVKLTVTP